MKVLSSVAALSGGRIRGPAAKLLLGGAAAAAIASTALGGSLATAATHPARGPATVPTSDIVGTGLVNCAAATGEVGYSPASKAGGTSPLVISVWFTATKCSPAPGSQTTPVPKSVIGSISVSAKNTCPLAGVFGTGTLDLTYNYPGVVPNPMIDPSVATNVTLSNTNPPSPFWTLTGAVTSGSYMTSPPTPFTISFKPNVIAGNCAAGITSEYIARSNGPFTNI
ncbi:MAG TPA: hypothetical protein VKS82_21720 [Streptosporangiaceae bacterium]|nr:hypothetical protein [Streptosporangiaceae bacterium]